MDDAKYWGRFRFLLAFFATVLLVAGGLIWASPAQAASVPPGVLGECDDPGDRGGWSGGRDQIGTGTYSVDPSPVRGRSVRLGEPCWYEGAFDWDYLSMPLQVTDAPVPILDADDDGEDDGAPETAVPCDEYDGPAAITASQIVALSSFCTGEMSVPWTGGGDQFEPSGDVARLTVTAGSTAGTISWSLVGSTFTSNATSKGFTASMVCRNTTTGVPHTATTYSVLSLSWSTTPPATLTGTASCSALGAGYEVYRVVISSRAGGAVGSGDRISGLVWEAGTTPPTGEVGTGYYGGTQEAPILLAPLAGEVYYGGATVATSSTFSCASSYDGPISSTWVIQPKVVNENSFDTPVTDEGSFATVYDWVGIAADPLFQGELDCPFLNRIDLYVCTWAGNGPDTDGCYNVFWTADKWRGNTPYTGTDGGPTTELLCELYPNSPGCYEVLNPPYIDGTDFAQVCAGAPEFVAPGWANFADWIPSLVAWAGESVGHYAECLFVPVNGWDRNGELAAAWESSATGELGTVLTSSYESLVGITGTCGELGAGTINDLSWAIDTCSWGWAADIRGIAVAIVLVLGGWGIVQLLLRTVLGIMSGNMPDPTDAGGSSAK